MGPKTDRDCCGEDVPISPNPHMDQCYHELENRDYEGIKAVAEV